MSRIPGVLTAVVKSVEDPLATGRIQVSYDWMDGAPESSWARVAAPMAGDQDGCFLMPVAGDEVLVAFDHGDVGHPYIVGYCWSGAAKPPYSGNVKKRGITTPAKSELTFDDDQKSIVLKTPGGFALSLDETKKQATLATQSGISVQLDDNATSVTISIPSGNQIQIGPSGVTVSASAGTLDITASSATITASSLTLAAGSTTITGVLTVAGAVTAASISAPVYSPGVGNLL